MTVAEPGVTAQLAAGGMRLAQRAMGEVVIRADPDEASKLVAWALANADDRGALPEDIRS